MSSLTVSPWDTRKLAILMIFIVAGLLSLGLVMSMSSSLEVAARYSANEFHFAIRHGVYLCVGLLMAGLIYKIPTRSLQSSGSVLVLIGFALLVLVLIPGVGHEVNGSRRWLKIGPITLQASEIAKLFTLIYLADFLARRQYEVRETWRGFVKPMAVLMLVSLLFLQEPDFGSFAVFLVASMGVIFMSGVRLTRFFTVVCIGLLGVVALAYTQAYRVDRILSFSDPFAFRYGIGYQLTQSLIAFGRGEWFGVGLGESVQKLFYLPEAHTDFVLAVVAEELGLISVVLITVCYFMITLIAFRFGFTAELRQHFFSAYLAYGIGLLMGIQGFVNIGVNIGLLPTKGLTLPLVSYGGSSLVVSMCMIAILLRIERELSVEK